MNNVLPWAYYSWNKPTAKPLAILFSPMNPGVENS